MATIKTFEDLDVWQKARELSRVFYQYAKSDGLDKNFELYGQMKRSVGSIMDNIAEGYERDGNKEFIQYLSISKGSSGEFKSQCFRAHDWNNLILSHFEDLKNKAEEISKSLNGFIEYLKKTDFKGLKYKTQN